MLPYHCVTMKQPNAQ